MSFIFHRPRSRKCVVCGDEHATCKSEDSMEPQHGGVVLDWNPAASIYAEPVTIPSFNQGTVTGRFAKKNAEATIAEETVKKPRRVRAKKEATSGTEAEGSGTRGQVRGRRGRRRRGAEGPERPGTIG